MRRIITLRETFGVFPAHADIAPMGRGDSLPWPRRTSGVTVSFVGENAAVGESQAAWDNVNLVAKKLGALIRTSSELDEDAAVDLGNWLAAELAYGFAKKEDDCGFNGDGTSAYFGILMGCSTL